MTTKPMGFRCDGCDRVRRAKPHGLTRDDYALLIIVRFDLPDPTRAKGGGMMNGPLVTIAALSATVESLVNQTDLLRTEARMRPVKWTTQIYDLGDDAYTLREPVLVLIEEYPEEVNIVARLPELELFGEGKTVSEALLALKHSMLDLYDELVAEDIGALGYLPQSWLRILNRLISKIELSQ